MKLKLDGKVFRAVSHTANAEVGLETLFHYRQRGDVVTAEYAGGAIIRGQLLARVLPSGQLDMRYHHLNVRGELMVGQCMSTPEVLPDGRLKLRECWQWLTGDRTSGYSEVEEVPAPAPPP